MDAVEKARAVHPVARLHACLLPRRAAKDSLSGFSRLNHKACPLLRNPFSRIFRIMEVQFKPEHQVQLAQIAAKAGILPERLATSLLSRYLDGEARFLAAVEKGIAAAERGEFIEEEEMDARLETMFKV